MKCLLFFFFSLLSIQLFAQHTPIPNLEVSGNPYEFSKVIKVDSTETSEALYYKALEWFAVTYSNSLNVLQMQDKGAGIIIGKGTFSYVLTKYSNPNVKYTIKIAVKNGRIKYTISDFIDDYYQFVYDGEVTKAPWVTKGTIKKAYATIQTAIKEHAESLDKNLDSWFKSKRKEEDF